MPSPSQHRSVVRLMSALQNPGFVACAHQDDFDNLETKDLVYLFRKIIKFIPHATPAMLQDIMGSTPHCVMSAVNLAQLASHAQDCKRLDLSYHLATQGADLSLYGGGLLVDFLNDENFAPWARPLIAANCSQIFVRGRLFSKACTKNDFATLDALDVSKIDSFVALSTVLDAASESNHDLLAYFAKSHPDIIEDAAHCCFKKMYSRDTWISQLARHISWDMCQKLERHFINHQLPVPDGLRSRLDKQALLSHVQEDAAKVGTKPGLSKKI